MLIHSISPSSFLRTPDRSRAMGLMLMALAAGAAYLARNLPLVHQGTVGPGAFPWLLASGLALCGLAMLLKPPPVGEVAPHAPGAWTLLAAVVLFPLLMPFLGSLLSTAICGTAVARVTAGSWQRATVMGSGLAAGLHGLIMWGLGTPMPWWIP